MSSLVAARIGCFLLLLGAFSARAHAQATRWADPLEVYLVSFGPGDEVWEKFGHNMLIVEDRSAGTAVAYHYGVFSFDQPNFIGRFILGRMLYSMGREDVAALDEYVVADRDVLTQHLNLTASQKQRLRDYLEANWQPANRNYLYEYYRANCSTKLRDALDAPGVLDGRLKRDLDAIPTGTTYRWHTRIGMSSDRIVYTGLELALGRGADEPISAWQESFIPMKLAEHLRNVHVKDDAGNLVPLVRSERMSHRSSRPPLPSQPPTWWPWFLLIGIAYSGALLLSARRASGPVPATPASPPPARKRATQASQLSYSTLGPKYSSPRWRWSALSFAALSILWALVSGLAGCFLIFTLTTDHQAAHRNVNLYLFTPISLLLIVFAPSAVRKKRFLPHAKFTSVAVLVLAILAVIINLCSSPRQMNWDLVALAMPIYFAIALAMCWMRGSSSDNLKRVLPNGHGQ